MIVPRDWAKIWPAAAIMLAACGSNTPADTTKIAETVPEIEVLVVRESKATGERAYRVTSTVSVEHEADLLAEEEGRLVEVLADLGRRVRKGQVLARLDDTRVRKQVTEQRAEMKMIEAHAQQAEVLRQGAEVELQRQTELRKEGLGSQRDFDRARFNLESMKQETLKAQFNLERARAMVEAGELRLARMELRAPFDGIVARRYARVGELLLRDAKVLRVTELRPLLVRFTVPETRRAAVRPGSEVEIVPTGLAAGPIRARVLRTGFVVDAASGAVECTARLLEPLPPELVPGVSVEVQLGAAADEAKEIWVPAAAVRRTGIGSDAEVFVVKTDRLEKRAVRVGRETATSVEVLTGLAAGEKIAARITEKLQEGMSVRTRM